MVRFHFKNNRELDNGILSLCEEFKIRGITAFINNFLFESEQELILFITSYCSDDKNFKSITGCGVSRKVSIPEPVYHSMKLCHKELDTFSIAVIWRSFLIDVLKCFTEGGFDAWQEFKFAVIESVLTSQRKVRNENKNLIKLVKSVHMHNFKLLSINRISFFDRNNEFLGYLHC